MQGTVKGGLKIRGTVWKWKNPENGWRIMDEIWYEVTRFIEVDTMTTAVDSGEMEYFLCYHLHCCWLVSLILFKMTMEMTMTMMTTSSVLYKMTMSDIKPKTLNAMNYQMWFWNLYDCCCHSCHRRSLGGVIIRREEKKIHHRLSPVIFLHFKDYNRRQKWFRERGGDKTKGEGVNGNSGKEVGRERGGVWGGVCIEWKKRGWRGDNVRKIPEPVGVKRRNKKGSGNMLESIHFS